jgi:hypothetical protein
MINIVRDIKGVRNAKNFKPNGFCRTTEQEVLNLLDEPKAQ